MKSNLDTVFEDFIEKIILTHTQRERIDKTVQTATNIFDSTDVRLQGSFATGTTVKPLTQQTSKSGVAGEYDADIALVSGLWSEPVGALDEVLELLGGVYGGKVDRSKERNSCQRVYFAEEPTGVAFHADYVPIKMSVMDETACVDREQREWRLSPTFQIIDCYNVFSANNPFASSCLLILKRLRDFNEHTHSLSSITLLTLVYKNYSDKGSYVSDIRHLCVSMADAVSSGQSIIFHDQDGTVLTEELGQSIENKAQIIKLLKDFELALGALTVKNLDSMVDYLSIDFPANENDYPEQMDSLRQHGFSYDTLRGLSTVEIDSTEHKNRSFRRYRNAMHFTKDVDMKLQASNHRELRGKNLKARWRITNDQLMVPSDVRGVLMSCEGGNEFIRKETAKYDGLHRAELFIFERESRKIVAKGRYKVRKVTSL